MENEFRRKIFKFKLSIDQEILIIFMNVQTISNINIEDLANIPSLPSLLATQVNFRTNTKFRRRFTNSWGTQRWCIYLLFHQQSRLRIPKLLIYNKISRHCILMNARSLTYYLEKTQFQYGYHCAHVVPKDVIAMPCLNLTYYASQATLTTTPPKTPHINSQYTSQNSHIVMIDLPHKPLIKKGVKINEINIFN